MNFFKLKISTLTLLIALLAIGVSCTKLEDVQDIDLYVDTDILLTPLTLQILDANNGGELPGDLKITALGKDKDKLYTQLGKKELVATIGDGDKTTAILPVSVRKINPPSLENPIEFTLKIEAEGYLPMFKSYSLVTEDNTLDIVRLNRMATPSEGVAFESSSFDSPTTGIEEEVTFAAEARTGEGITAKIEPQTVLFNEAGDKLSGQVAVSLFQYDIHSNKGLNTLPGGLESNNARGLNGEELGNLQFTPIGAITLDMTVNGEDVKTFSKPIEISYKISSETVNPTTQEPYKEGDEVQVWSFNEKIGDWQLEKTVKVTTDYDSGLQVKYLQPHLSTWIVGGGRGCGHGANVTIISDIPYSAPQRFYYSELVDVDTDEILGEPKFFRYYNGELIRFRRVSDHTVFIRVYDGTSEECRGALLGESDPFDLCSGNYTFDFSGVLNTDNIFTANVNIRGVCSSDFNDLVILPTLAILYRETGCTTWSALGMLISGHGSTSALEKGKTYDFRIPFGRGVDKCLLNFTIPSEDTQVLIDSPVYDFQETVDVVFTNNGKQVDLNYTSIQVPDLACQEYIDLYKHGRRGE